MNDDGSVRFNSEFDPLRTNKLLECAFYSMLTEPDVELMRKVYIAIEMLVVADICACKNPEFMLELFCECCESLTDPAAELISSFDANPNFELATV